MIRIHDDDPPFTISETAQLSWCVARMAKRGLAGDDVDQTDMQRKIDRIVRKARKRAGMK